jgi:GDPmannose 4,6-dehydratase
MSQRAIVMGATGQDGVLLSNLLCTEGLEVLGLHRGRELNESQLIRHRNPNMRLSVIGDYRDPKLTPLIRDFSPDYVFALHGNSYSLSNEITQKNFICDPVSDFVYHMEILSQIPKKVKYLLASSSEIYAGTKVEHIDEGTKPNPSTPYGLGKLNLLNAGRYYRETESREVFGAILFPHESEYRRNDFVIMKLVESIVDVHFRGKAPLVFGDLTTSRDFGSARDYVNWMYKLVQHGISDDYCFATGVNTPLNEIIRLISEILGIELEILEVNGQLLYVSKLDVSRVYLISDPIRMLPTNYTYSAGTNQKLFGQIGPQEITGIKKWLQEMISFNLPLLV